MRKLKLEKLLNLIVLAIQFAFAFFVIFCFYMFSALYEYEGGFTGFIGLTLFQPMAGAFFAGLTIVFCFILGLPLRIHNRISYWWRTKTYFALIIILFGFCSLISSFFFSNEVYLEEREVMHTAPNQILWITGWFFTAFGCLHLFPPANFREKINRIFSNSITSN